VGERAYLGGSGSFVDPAHPRLQNLIDPLPDRCRVDEIWGSVTILPEQYRGNVDPQPTAEPIIVTKQPPADQNEANIESDPADYLKLEQTAEALNVYYLSDPDRSSRFGGIYLDHENGESALILQLVVMNEGTHEEVMQAVPELSSTGLVIKQVRFAYLHLQAASESVLSQMPTDSPITAVSLNTSRNRVQVIIASTDENITPGPQIDKSTLPLDLAQLLADPVIEVISGEPVMPEAEIDE